ncbi:hypothetical protein GQR58_004136 [Nymphon striatum]|nr:hypothetical protein GQR58_004136 [Nymphon striatum]
MVFRVYTLTFMVGFHHICYGRRDHILLTVYSSLSGTKENTTKPSNVKRTPDIVMCCHLSSNYRNNYMYLRFKVCLEPETIDMRHFYTLDAIPDRFNHTGRDIEEGPDKVNSLDAGQLKSQSAERHMSGFVRAGNISPFSRTVYGKMDPISVWRRVNAAQHTAKLAKLILNLNIKKDF